MYVDNELLAFGSSGSINGVALPAGGNYIFPNIYIEAPTIELLKHTYSLTSGAGSWKELFTGRSARQPSGTTSLNGFISVIKTNAVTLMHDLRYELDVEIFGIAYLSRQDVL